MIKELNQWFSLIDGKTKKSNDNKYLEFTLEELKEAQEVIQEAIDARDRGELSADHLKRVREELTDVSVTTSGFYFLSDFDEDEDMREVCRSNMTKIYPPAYDPKKINRYKEILAKRKGEPMILERVKYDEFFYTLLRRKTDGKVMKSHLFCKKRLK
jgi:predicted HAD superfamily Cof-like phosphohydrolase